MLEHLLCSKNLLMAYMSSIAMLGLEGARGQRRIPLLRAQEQVPLATVRLAPSDAHVSQASCTVPGSHFWKLNNMGSSLVGPQHMAGETVWFPFETDRKGGGTLKQRQNHVVLLDIFGVACHVKLFRELILAPWFWQRMITQH